MVKVYDVPSVNNVEPYHPSNSSISKTPIMMNVTPTLYSTIGDKACFLTLTSSALVMSYNSESDNIIVKSTVQCTKFIEVL